MSHPTKRIRYDRMNVAHVAPRPDKPTFPWHPVAHGLAIVAGLALWGVLVATFAGVL